MIGRDDDAARAAPPQLHNLSRAWRDQNLFVLHDSPPGLTNILPAIKPFLQQTTKITNPSLKCEYGPALPVAHRLFPVFAVFAALLHS